MQTKTIAIKLKIDFSNVVRGLDVISNLLSGLQGSVLIAKERFEKLNETDEDEPIL